MARAPYRAPEAVAATRTALLARLIHKRLPIPGFCLPQGGIGRVEQTEEAYRFVAGSIGGAVSRPSRAISSAVIRCISSAGAA